MIKMHAVKKNQQLHNNHEKTIKTTSPLNSGAY